MTSNDAAAKEHAPDVERSVRTVKECIRATVICLSHKEAKPTLTTIEAVNNSVMMLNSFPLKRRSQLDLTCHPALQ